MKKQNIALDQKFMRLNVKLLGNPSDLDETEYKFDAVATTFGDMDREGDVIRAGAFDQGLIDVEPKLLWQHKQDEPLGTISDIRATENEITFRGNMPKNDKFVADRVMPQLRQGSLDISIGFMATDIDYIDGVRTIKEGVIFEISLVTIPANPRAVVTAVKSIKGFKELPLADLGCNWNLETALDHVKSLEENNNAFLCSDSQNDEITKFLIADLIEGELKAIPRAIFNCAANYQSKNANLISEQDEIVFGLEKYYEKMGRESPFKKGFGASELSTLSADDMVAFLRSKPLLSKSGAKFFVEKLFAGSEKAGDIQAELLRRIKQTTQLLKG
jgi:HK97 family phage prohead protease